MKKDRDDLPIEKDKGLPIEKDRNDLPPNFDKYSSMIKYYIGKGIDCLNSINERRRFYIGFKIGLKSYLNLMNESKKFVWYDPNCRESYNIYDGTFTDIHGRTEYLTDPYLYKNYLKWKILSLNHILMNYNLI